MRALIQNMVTGVDELFTKTLIAEGVGYKFQAEKTKLVMNVGFTHPVEFSIPSDLTIKQEGPTKIHISGIDREKVGLLASKIRDVCVHQNLIKEKVFYMMEKKLFVKLVKQVNNILINFKYIYINAMRKTQKNYMYNKRNVI